MARLNLPSARRTVRRGVGVCRRMGYTDEQALGLIVSVCAAVAKGTPNGGAYDLTWVAEVHQEAICQQRTLRQRRG